MTIKKAVIFTNGEFNITEWSIKIAKSADYVIAADGGARHAIALGIKVHELIGDMDSVSAADSDKLKSDGAKIIIYPEDKDKTDLELALDSALQKGAEEIHILAGYGGRFDHIIGNALLPAGKKYIDKEIWFYSNEQKSIVLGEGAERYFEVTPGSIISVIPLSKVEDFCIEGVKWPLKNVALDMGSTFTISNEAIDRRVDIRYSSGKVILIMEDTF